MGEKQQQQWTAPRAKKTIFQITTVKGTASRNQPN
jgi:hypothetical protein